MISRLFVFDDDRNGGLRSGRKPIALPVVTYGRPSRCDHHMIGEWPKSRPAVYRGLVNGEFEVEATFAEGGTTERIPPMLAGDFRQAYREFLEIELVHFKRWPESVQLPAWVIFDDEVKEYFPPVPILIELIDPGLTHNSLFRIAHARMSFLHYQLRDHDISRDEDVFLDMEHIPGDIIPFTVQSPDIFGALVLEGCIGQTLYSAQIHSARSTSLIQVGQMLSMHATGSLPQSARSFSAYPDRGEDAVTQLTAMSHVGRIVKFL